MIVRQLSIVVSRRSGFDLNFIYIYVTLEISYNHHTQDSTMDPDSRFAAQIEIQRTHRETTCYNDHTEHKIVKTKYHPIGHDIPMIVSYIVRTHLRNRHDADCVYVF